MILTSLDLTQCGKCSVNNSAGERPARDIVRLKTGMQFGMDGLDMRRVGAVVMILTSPGPHSVWTMSGHVRSRHDTSRQVRPRHVSQVSHPAQFFFEIRPLSKPHRCFLDSGPRCKV